MRNFKNFSVIGLFSIFAVIFILNGILAQGSMYQWEIIVMTKGEVFELPEGTNEAPYEEVTVLSEDVEAILSTYEAETIARAIPGFTEEDRNQTSRLGKPVQLADWTKLFVVKLTDSSFVDDAIDELDQVYEDIVFAEPNSLVEVDAEPDDLHSNQWNLKNTGQSGGTPGADIHAVNGWDITTGSSNILIGIVDAGIENNHNDLNPKLVNYDNSAAEDYHA
ncbi:MAG: hypothetical protein GWN62_27820 [Aliifodinibius sp.]|nr:hypothetical protein [Fodinibius sp.]